MTSSRSPVVRPRPETTSTPSPAASPGRATAATIPAAPRTGWGSRPNPAGSAGTPGRPAPRRAQQQAREKEPRPWQWLGSCRRRRRRGRVCRGIRTSITSGDTSQLGDESINHVARSPHPRPPPRNRTRTGCSSRCRSRYQRRRSMKGKDGSSTRGTIVAVGHRWRYGGCRRRRDDAKQHGSGSEAGRPRRLRPARERASGVVAARRSQPATTAPRRLASTSACSGSLRR